LANGFFIVFEGPDGSGKSTQAERLSSRLEDEGYNCLYTEEPGGTEVGILLRDILLDPEKKISERTELFLFLADRSEHVHKIIVPALNEGMVVVSSRYLYSTIVYQGFARKLLPLSLLWKLNRFAVADTMPDIVFYLDVCPEEGLFKATKGSVRYKGGDRIEREGTDLQQRVRDSYCKLASRYRKQWVVLEGRNIEEIGELVYEETKRRMGHD
jgi:dTMP kinase